MATARGPWPRRPRSVRLGCHRRAAGRGRDVVVVDDDGPAHRAGIVPGDVVMRVGARPVHRTLDAANVVLGSEPGTHVAVDIVRRGVPTIVDIELAPVPASQAAL